MSRGLAHVPFRARFPGETPGQNGTFHSSGARRAALAFSTHIRKAVPEGRSVPGCVPSSEHTTRQRLVAFLKHTGFGRGGHRATRCGCSSPGVPPAPGTPLPQPQGTARAGWIEPWLWDPTGLPKQTASSLGALAFPLPPCHTKSVSAPSRRRDKIASETPGHARWRRLS